MGLLDDLAMGFGLKERTEDYDARTARNIAETQAFGDDHHAVHRARQGYVSTGPRGRDYAAEYQAAFDNPRGQAQRFLGSRGYDEGYTPQRVEDNRPFMQRLLFSPESTPSPTPYAIGPVSFDEPLRMPTMFGLLGGLLSGFGRDETAPEAPAAPSPYVSSGQPETTFTEDFGGVEMAEIEEPMPVDALTELTESAISAAPDATGLTLITRGPHAGKYIDSRGRLVMP